MGSWSLGALNDGFGGFKRCVWRPQTLFKEEVHEVYLGFLLFRCGVLLQEGRDAEGIAELVEALGVEGYLGPLAEGFALWVGVGEDNDSVLKQGFQKFWFEHLEAAA